MKRWPVEREIMFLPRSRISSGEDKLFLDSEGFRPRFGKHASPA
jgi:hypothetical protein